MQKTSIRQASLSLLLTSALALGLAGCAKAESPSTDTEKETPAVSEQLTTEAKAPDESDKEAEQEKPADNMAEEASKPSEAETESEAEPAAEQSQQASTTDEKGRQIYTDANGDSASIPANFSVSPKEDEQIISHGLVVIAPDGSEFVWIPTDSVGLSSHDFGSYFSGGSNFSDFYDETDLDSYQAMAASVEKHGGFYLSRYEASEGSDGLPVSKRSGTDGAGSIWVHYSPQDATEACERVYADNESIQGFFPWGANWDTTLMWLIHSGDKSWEDVAADSSSWGNYSNDSFSEGAGDHETGAYEEAKANNIYDLAGNNWEWTQERMGSNYVMRSGGCTLMGRGCSGSNYPAAIRDPLPGNNHHPNVAFRVGLYLT